MSLVKGGDLLVRSLIKNKVSCTFIYPGNAVVHIFDALFHQKEIKNYMVRHEQGGGHMADAYCRATGQIGVVIATSGPGATNLITPIATAYTDSIPMLIITGQVSSHKIGKDAFQEVDIVNIAKPITKATFQIKHISEISRVVDLAIAKALSAKQGPVLIDIPYDITNHSIEDNELYKENKNHFLTHPSINESTKTQLNEVYDLIKSSKKPLLYIGGGVLYSESSQILLKLAEALKIPVVSSLMGLGAISRENMIFLGMVGMYGDFKANMAMHYSDLIISLGSRFDDRVINNPEKFCPEAKIIQINSDPDIISKIIPVDICIINDIKISLQYMYDILESDTKINYPSYADWWNLIKNWQDYFTHLEQKELNHDESSVIKPQDVIKELSNLTQGNAIITSDVGQHQMFVAKYYDYKKPRSWINSGSFGTMGVGLPYAIAAKIAFPKEEVICITSDGSIQMCLQELSTCSQYDINVKIICINNQALGMVKQWEDIYADTDYSSSQSYINSLPDFKKYIESFGHVCINIHDKNLLVEQLKEALSITDKCVFVNIFTDPTEHLYPVQIPNGSMRDMLVAKGIKNTF